PCTVLPGHYFLVQEFQGAGGTTSLPPPDATGTTNLSASDGKVALVTDTAALADACPVGGRMVDLVGYGTANCFETAATAGLSNPMPVVGRGNGCFKTAITARVFFVFGPTPRHSGAPPTVCGPAPALLSGMGIASPASIEPAGNTLLTVQVIPASMPPST